MFVVSATFLYCMISTDITKIRISTFCHLVMFGKLVDYIWQKKYLHSVCLGF